jgi:hypothetical protein
MARLIDYIASGFGIKTTEATAKGQDPRPEMKKAKPKTFQSSTTSGTDFTVSPYDFTSIDKILDVDSYARRALSRKIELLWKEGYILRGANPDAVRYIEQRFFVLGLAMGQPFDDYLKEVSTNLLKYHNNFSVKIRDDRPQQLTGMKYQGLGGPAVAGYSCASVPTISIKSDANMRVKGYKQQSGNNTNTLKTEEVIHTTHDRQTGELWGKPSLSAVVEDIRSFRIIEEDALNLVHKEMYPLYVYKIGDDLRQPEQDDINKAGKALQDLREDGGLAMAGKDSIDVVGAGGKTIDVRNYIDHFKERVVVGMGVAGYQIGLESNVNKSSAERLDAMLYDQIKSYGHDIEHLVTNDIIFELLLEGGFDPLGIASKNGITDSVTFKFKEIDVTSQIARENHISLLWLQNQITHGQMRQAMGLEVDPLYQDMYHFDMIESRSAQLQADNQLELARVSAANRPTATPSTNKGGVSPKSPAKGAAKSKDQPANQHGKKPAPKTVA